MALRDAHWRGWEKVIGHPFLRLVSENALSQRSAQAWIEQNYHFVEGMLAFQADLLKRAPQRHRLVLANGLSSIVEDLDWMLYQPIDLAAPPHPARQRYIAFLRMLGQQPYPVGITGLWAINRIFHDAWNAAAPRSRAFMNLAEHWSLPEFMAYLHDLSEAAAEALDAASEDEVRRINALIEEIIRLELASWDMAQAFAKAYG